ncbi:MULTISPECIES: hypothetical protein [unclassified Gilliamella]|uniref:hypothetical protein n=1 Tax=unclassified Gilliamella TaxID=2685620 RepID=UPI00226AD0BD|nr:MULTISPECIES: hypothetical protein [unclassified Gilliamella]MCX8602671.1 hypothetical protein [Gilliamella sp. B3722]MCX8607711.1 hypothetical protein [Gilliamella sp. B3771]MCX8611907.1 hypothetical protein [Gilliamella sp. B3891]MCX8614359.1 hypothetical protein [Gilliamella sp. B3773]MCX8621611.1 hypothetical protein [Gilliamella sp. B3892]
MITLTIEENKGDIKFKVDGINTSTDDEKTVLSIILSSLDNEFEIDKRSIKMDKIEQLEKENGK